MEDNGYWGRFQQTFTRRALIRSATAGGTGIAAAALLGCSGSNNVGNRGASTDTRAPKAAGNPVKGGEVVFGDTPQAREVMDPHVSVSLAINTWSMIGDRAIVIDEHSFEPKPALVQSWEQTSSTEYVFKVRPSAKWHNKPPTSGRNVTAEDIAYNFERIVGLAGPTGARPRQSTVGPLTSAKAVDNSTLRVTLDRPFSPFFVGLADFRNTMVPKDFAEQVGFEDPNRFVGSGPFVLQEYRFGETSTFTRNPDYWPADGRPYFDKARFVVLPDESTQISAFVTRQHDWILAQEKNPRETVMKLDANATLYKWDSLRWDHLRFSVNEPPFNDARIRKAFQRVLDYEVLGQAEYGAGFWNYTGPLVYPFPEAFSSDEIRKMPGWNPSTKDKDIQDAKQLMAAAGQAEGALDFPILAAPGNAAYSNHPVRVQDMLKKVWPRMNPRLDVPADFTLFNQRQNNGDYKGGLVSYRILSPFDPVIDLQGNYHSKGSRNYSKFSDSRIDQILDQALVELDRNRRKDLLQEVQRLLINDHMYIITLLAAGTAYLANPSIRGFAEWNPGAGGPGTSEPREAASRYWKVA